LQLIYDFTESDFVKFCVTQVQRNRTTIFEDIYKALSYFLHSPSDDSAQITQIKNHYETDYYDEYLSLNEYIEKGFIEFYYPSIELSSKLENPLCINEVVFPQFIQQLGINYGNGTIRKIKVKNHNLKTKNKITVLLLHIRIDACVLINIKELLPGRSTNLLPSKLQVWEWRQTFYEKISGKSYFCKCFELAIKKRIENSWQIPHQHIAYALKTSSFKDNICHLCNNTNSDLFYCSDMYGSVFKVKYGAYIKKTEIERDLDEREAENIVREMKGVDKIGGKKINETLLFNYIRTLFPKFEIYREASPPWLGRLRLDIFIPELKLALEYQGKQHYMEIDYFGGKIGFNKIKERDKLKKMKCKKNDISIIYFTYKDNLTEKLIMRRLKKYF